MPPNWAKWNLRRAAAVKKSRLLRRSSGNPPVSRVGFDCRFGVKLAVLWAVESSLPLISDGSKHFKSLRKLAGKGKATTVMHITWFDPECIQAFKSGTGPPRWRPVSGFFTARLMRNPSRVGPFVPTCKIGISL
jgi:hypothetical protein